MTMAGCNPPSLDRYALRVGEEEPMSDDAVAVAVSAFGKATSARLSSAAASGEPEDQLRGPFENLLQQLALLCGF